MDKFRKVAILDLGTNVLNFLVVEKQDTILNFSYREKLGVAFGAGSMQSRWISDDALERTIQGLVYFQNKAQALGCSDVRLFATEVLRNANNRSEILSTIERATGLKVNVVSGEQEALWIAKAAMHARSDKRKALILDIGGGSLELILVEDQAIRKLKSLPLGVVRLLELKDWSDPLTLQDVQWLHAHFELICSGFLEDIDAKILVGTAGIFDTLVEMSENYGQNSRDLECLNLPWVKKLLTSWRESTREERELYNDIIPVRRKTLHIAAVFLLWIIDKLAIEELIATPNSLAEGAALDYFSQQNEL